MLRSAREIVQYRPLLRNLIARELKVRYKRSVLGVLWTMLNPLMMMLVFTVVFAHFLRFQVEHFAIYFLSAFVLWNFVAQTTSWSTGCLMGYAPLITKVYVPKAIFVLATVLAGLVNLLISLIPLAIIMIIVGHPMTASLAFLPIPIVLATLFSLGVSLFLAPLCLVFADIVPLYQVILMAWMYLTPIFYPLEIIPEEYRIIVRLNPMTYFVEAFRAPIYSGALPSNVELLRAGVSAFVALVTGMIVFDRYSDRIAYYV
jgi:homopolymeric O-antigen transport system permease protein